MIDTHPPTLPSDQTVTLSTDHVLVRYDKTPAISWIPATDDVGIDRYEIAVGTAPNNLAVSDWVSKGTATNDQSLADLSVNGYPTLESGLAYYIRIRACDAVDRCSEYASTPSFQVGPLGVLDTSFGEYNQGIFAARELYNEIPDFDGAQELYSGAVNADSALTSIFQAADGNFIVGGRVWELLKSENSFFVGKIMSDGSAWDTTFSSDGHFAASYDGGSRDTLDSSIVRTFDLVGEEEVYCVAGGDTHFSTMRRSAMVCFDDSGSLFDGFALNGITANNLSSNTFYDGSPYLDLIFDPARNVMWGVGYALNSSNGSSGYVAKMGLDGVLDPNAGNHITNDGSNIQIVDEAGWQDSGGDQFFGVLSQGTDDLLIIGRHHDAENGLSGVVRRLDIAGTQTSWDSTFGGGDGVFDFQYTAGKLAGFRKAVIDPITNEIYVAGYSHKSDDRPLLTVVKLTADGVPVSGWGKAVSWNGTVTDQPAGVTTIESPIDSTTCNFFGSGMVEDLVLQPDGKIILTGQVCKESSDYANLFIARIDSADGSLDTSFAGGGLHVLPSNLGELGGYGWGDARDSIGRDIILSEEGNPVIAGSFAHTHNGKDNQAVAVLRFK